MNLIHDRLSITVLLYFTAMGLWGAWRFIHKQGLNGNYWGAVVISEVLVLIQGGVGVFLWFSNLRPERGGIHVLYGVITALSIPAVYGITKGRDERRDQLIYALVFIFAAVIAVRARITGG
jgi:hypothetical protein